MDANGIEACKQARAHFSEHLDGEPLPFAARLLVRLHLLVCPPCRRTHRSLAATRDALASLRDADLPADEKL